MEIKSIVFKVKAYKNLSIDSLEPFQGDLKKLSEENFNKLRSEIISNGYNFAQHIWVYSGHNYIIDGHQRNYVLAQLKKSGYKFIDSEGKDLNYCIPCNIVEAESIEDAKRKVLQAVSQYGKLTNEGYIGFVDGLDLDFTNFDLPDFTPPDLPQTDEFEFNPKEKSDNDTQDFTLRITCENDIEQEELFQELNDRGYKVKK